MNVIEFKPMLPKIFDCDEAEIAYKPMSYDVSIYLRYDIDGCDVATEKSAIEALRNIKDRVCGKEIREEYNKRFGKELERLRKVELLYNNSKANVKPRRPIRRRKPT